MLKLPTGDVRFMAVRVLAGKFEVRRFCVFGDLAQEAVS